MKWICWICGRENPFRPLKAVQDKCPKCGDELRTGRAPLATTTNIAGFLLMIGGVFWGMDHLVPASQSARVYRAGRPVRGGRRGRYGGGGAASL